MKITTARDLAAHLTDLCGGAQVLCVSEEEAREAMHSLGLTRYDEDAAVRWVAEGVLPSDDPLDGGKAGG